MKIVAVSGGFDPLHPGHIRMFKEASTYGSLVVILNSDQFLAKKKGKPFMSFDERKEVIEAIGCVDRVIPCIDKDMTVCETLRHLKPHVFANGGDRVAGNVPEANVCAELGIEMLYGVGGGKIQSSSKLLNEYGA